YAAPILFRSAFLSRLLVLPRMTGVRRFPVTLLGALGAGGLLATGPKLGWILAPILALAWLLLPISQIPWVPWTARLRVGKPIAHEELFPDESDDALARSYERVRAAVEALLRR